MSIELDPKEVLQGLNELGYYNISSKQLKEFLKDLKTLIKHDIRKLTKKENEENICPNENLYYNFNPNTQNTNINNNLNDIHKVKQNPEVINELFEHLYSTSTASSRAKSVPKHNGVISIDIRKAKRHSEPALPLKTSTDNTDRTKSSSWTTIDSKTDINIIKPSTTSNPNIKSKPSTSSKVCCCCARTEISCKKTTNANTLKPRVSFIKPRQPVKTCKSDPVSLYQQYQKEWKKQKLPGEDKRYDLRWAIRERMLGEPELPVHPLDKVKKSNNKF